MATDTQIYLDLLEAAFVHLQGQFRTNFLNAEKEYAIRSGILILENHHYHSDYQRLQLIELAVARINQIKADQKTFFGANGKS